MKGKFKTFQDKVKQYVIFDFDNPSYIIIVFQYLKDPYAHIEIYNPRNLSK